MTLDKEAKVAVGPSSNIWRLSKEQLDPLLESSKSNLNPTAEQMSELAEKVKLATGQVQLWFRKQRLEMEALTLEAQCPLQGIVPPKLHWPIQQDEEVGLLRDKLKLLVQENEQGTGSSNIPWLSKEQLDLLLEASKSIRNPKAEQMSQLAEKLKLTTGQVQLWFRKERLERQASTLEAQCLFEGMLPPALQRHIQQDEVMKLLQDKLKLLVQEDEQGTGSSNISGLSKEQLDLLLETFDRNPNPSAEQTSEVAQKLKLTTGQVQLWFLNQRKRKEAATLEVECLLQGIVTPAFRRLLEQDERFRALKLKLDGLREEENKLRIAMQSIKLMDDEVKELKQQLEQLIAERENLVGEIQLSRPPTPGRCCDTGMPSYRYRMRKRATEDSSDEQGEKKARRRD